MMHHSQPCIEQKPFGEHDHSLALSHYDPDPALRPLLLVQAAALPETKFDSEDEEEDAGAKEDEGSEYEDEEEAYVAQLQKERNTKEEDEDDEYVPEGATVPENKGEKKMTKKAMQQMQSENQRLIRETKTRFPQSELKRKDLGGFLSKLKNRTMKIDSVAPKGSNIIEIAMEDSEDSDDELDIVSGPASPPVSEKLTAVYTKTMEEVEVLQTHWNDTAPYFTIKTKDGVEKQTEQSYLQGLPAHLSGNKPTEMPVEKPADESESVVCMDEEVENHELQMEDMSENEDEASEEATQMPPTEDEEATQLNATDPAEQETEVANEEEAETQVVESDADTQQVADEEEDSADAETEVESEEEEEEEEVTEEHAAMIEQKRAALDFAEAKKEAEMAALKAADPLAFLMQAQEEQEKLNPKKDEGPNFINAEAEMDEEDIYDYGSDENEEGLDGEVEGLVDKEATVTSEDQEAARDKDQELANEEDDKRIKEMEAVIRGERRGGRRGQYRRAGMREGLLDEEDDDSDDSEGDSDEIIDGTESEESEGEAILGAHEDAAGSDADDWDEEKRRRLRLRRERLRRQELKEKGVEMEKDSRIGFEGTMNGTKQLIVEDDCSKSVFSMMSKTNVSKTGVNLSRNASLVGNLSRASSLGTVNLSNLSRTNSAPVMNAACGDAADVANKPVMSNWNKLRPRGSFLGMSASKREKAAGMGGSGSLTAGRASFVFSADDSQTAPGDGDSNTPSVTSRVAKMNPKSAKGRGKAGNKDNIARAGLNLFRSLSAGSLPAVAPKSVF